ncbi:MAG TPA: glutamate-5-semialdehyde dehydrogenase [Desulfomonilia bacterium]
MVEDIIGIAKRAKEASRHLATLGSSEKADVLKKMADAIMKNSAMLKEKNAIDVRKADANGLSTAMIDRLTLTDKVLEGMAAALTEIADLPDPIGSITNMVTRPNGLMVGRMRIPLGVVAMIYESRPNVTADAAGLCLKSGNACVLRGGSEAFNSNMAIVKVLKDTLEGTSINPDAIGFIPLTDRAAINEMLKLEEYIDLVIPRGGEGLIRAVAENSRIPVLKHYKGVCHIYVDKEADMDKAFKVCFNAKVQRPGVCNAMETLLVNQDIAEKFLPGMIAMFEQAGVEIRGCPKTKALVPSVRKDATEADWYEEYVDLILSVKVVDSLDEAIDHIEKYGSNHTEAIITENYTKAMRFLKEVDSSTVLVNASTRFSDGGQFGLGAEVGISTSKIHAYGPMGIEGLTIEKFVCFGDGHIRQ